MDYQINYISNDNLSWLFRIEDPNSHAGCLPSLQLWCCCVADGVVSGGKYEQDIIFNDYPNYLIDSLTFNIL